MTARPSQRALTPAPRKPGLFMRLLRALFLLPQAARSAPPPSVLTADEEATASNAPITEVRDELTAEHELHAFGDPAHENLSPAPLHARPAPIPKLDRRGEDDPPEEPAHDVIDVRPVTLPGAPRARVRHEPPPVKPVERRHSRAELHLPDASDPGDLGVPVGPPPAHPAADTPASEGLEDAEATLEMVALRNPSPEPAVVGTPTLHTSPAPAPDRTDEPHRMNDQGARAILESAVSDATSAQPDEPASVQAILADVKHWREKEEEQRQRKAAELDDALARFEAQLRAIQEQMLEFRDRRQALSQAVPLEREVAERARQGIVRTLEQQALDLHGRAIELARAQETHRDIVREALANDPEISVVWKEVRAFDPQKMPDLPASYQAALLGHHEAQQQRVRDFLAANDPGPVEVSGEPVRLDVVFAIDSEDGQPELISVVLPVSEQVHADWQDRGDDLQLQVAARAVQALYAVARDEGHPSAQVAYGGHEGMLAMELEMPRREGRDLAGLLARSLQDAFSGAPECREARLDVRAVEVDSDHLLPPAGNDGES